MEEAERNLALVTCGAGAMVEIVAGELRCQRLSSPVGTALPEGDFLKLTSGTTSQPRAIRFCSAQLVADCDNICETMGIGKEDLNFGVIPFSHSYGFSNLITPLLCRGVPLVYSEDRMPRAILDGLVRTQRHGFPGHAAFL